ncbi:hypothetical protein CF319_g7394 [Tilletia indica]|nr:hypothetical protein CF319_g7394 [Tilletia indica]
MFHHLQLVPLSLSLEHPRCCFPADAVGFAYLHRSSRLPEGTYPSLRSRSTRISFQNGVFRLHAVTSSSTARVNGSPLPQFVSHQIQQGDIIELGCREPSPFNPSLTFHVDLMTSSSPQPSFPGPNTDYLAQARPADTLPAVSLRRAMDDGCHYSQSWHTPWSDIAVVKFGRRRTTLHHSEGQDPLPSTHAFIPTSTRPSLAPRTALSRTVSSNQIPSTPAPHLSSSNSSKAPSSPALISTSRPSPPAPSIAASTPSVPRIGSSTPSSTPSFTSPPLSSTGSMRLTSPAHSSAALHPANATPYACIISKLRTRSALLPGQTSPSASASDTEAPLTTFPAASLIHSSLPASPSSTPTSPSTSVLPSASFTSSLGLAQTAQSLPSHPRSSQHLQQQSSVEIALSRIRTALLAARTFLHGHASPLPTPLDIALARVYTAWMGARRGLASMHLEAETGNIAPCRSSGRLSAATSSFQSSTPAANRVASTAPLSAVMLRSGDLPWVLLGGSGIPDGHAFGSKSTVPACERAAYARYRTFNATADWMCGPHSFLNSCITSARLLPLRFCPLTSGFGHFGFDLALPHQHGFSSSAFLV